APESYAGRSIACPRCGKQFAVGAKERSPRPPAPPRGPIQGAASSAPTVSTKAPERGAYKKQVAAGIKWLLKKQSSEGNFYQQGAGNNWFYAQGQCTIAVCELYGMTKDPALKRSAELAVKFCIDSQDPELGGWKYLPRSASDTSVTGWIMKNLAELGLRSGNLLNPLLQVVADGPVEQNVGGPKKC
ncbi:MAG: hypothetical protein ACREHD_20255, partial [Pirellulales bacterium]